jgi:hypothetical protein
VRDLGFLPAYKWDLPSFGMLLNIDWQLVTDVSGPPIGSFFKDKAVGRSWNAGPLNIGLTGLPETTVTNYKFKLRNIPERRRS